MSRIDLRRLFAEASEDVLCNTSYPLEPGYFAPYRASFDIMENVDALSFYLHVPFCTSFCRFCEYTKFLAGDAKAEAAYVDRLRRQIGGYLAAHPVRRLFGLDVGGGTPTALAPDAFASLMDCAKSLLRTLPLDRRFLASLECSFSTATEEKIALAADAGIRRISAGLQVFDRTLMAANGRPCDALARMQDVRACIRRAGIACFNVDLMYGLPGQTDGMLERTADAVQALRPEQVTLYELRANHIGASCRGMTRALLFHQYSLLFSRLTAMGYHGRFGRNTLSLSAGDFGLSSYLESRMRRNVPYKGFGVSAQSLSPAGMSYNSFKGLRRKRLPDFEEIAEEDVYRLPADERAAKFVCISLYGGEIDLAVLSGIVQEDAHAFYAGQLNFLERNGLAEEEGGILHLTEKGAMLAGGAAALFWSPHHAERYLSSRKRRDGTWQKN